MLHVHELMFQYVSSDFCLKLPRLIVPDNGSLAIVGPSGSGKTTLLNLLSGILQPQIGSIEIDGLQITEQTDAWRRNYRANHIGQVFQSFELIQYLSVLDNILLPARLTKCRNLSNLVERAILLAESTRIDDKLSRFPDALSQGESQRAAICRALLMEPKLILADEPTGNLDPTNKLKAVNLMRAEAGKVGAMLIMVTHDNSLIKDFDQIIDFENMGTSLSEREVSP